MPANKNWRQRFSCRFAAFMLSRRKNITVGKDSKISPEARINPRDGEIVIGDNVTIAHETMIQGKVKIGNNSSVQTHTLIVGYNSGEIVIGDGVRIAPFVIMIGADHKFDNPDIPIYKSGLNYNQIIIEDDVWIASRVNITAGVRIGKGSVIGAGSVVTKDIPPYSVAVGVPAKVIKTRKED